MYALLLNKSNLDKIASQLSDGKMCDVLIVGEVWLHFQMKFAPCFGSDVLVICALVDGKILEGCCYYFETMTDVLESACNLLYQPPPSESELLWSLALIIDKKSCV